MVSLRRGMVDFQERDTTRGFRFEDDEEDEEPPPGEEDGGEDPDIDDVRERLEESPGENGDAPGRNGDAATDGADASSGETDAAPGDGDPLAPAHDDAPGDGDPLAPAHDDGSRNGDSLTPHPNGDAPDGTDRTPGSAPPGDAGAGRDDRADSETAADDDAGGHDHAAADDGDGGDHGHGGEHDSGGEDHDHHHAHDVEQLGVAVVTVSSSRTLADDPSGDAIVDSLVAAGHDVVTRELVPDDHDDLQRSVDALVGRGDVDVVVTTGGTGVTPDDTTVEAVRPLLDKELPGFGELFRRLSYDDIGTKVVGTRATAGVAEGAPVFCLPGSEDAVTLAVEDIITEEAPHLAGLARRDEDEAGAE
jgi:molybdenum cofactor biosynthesis protein B